MDGAKMKFNPKNQKLPFEDFCYGKRGYIRYIDDLDNTNRNGYGLIGGFMARDEDEYKENKLYLSCSRGGEKEIYHLFTIKKDAPLLLATSKAQKGAVSILWKHMEDFLNKRTKKSPQQLLNMLLEQEQDRKTLKEVAFLILELKGGE